MKTVVKKGFKLEGHMAYQGLKVAIETGFGSHRFWRDHHAGESGATLMQHPYGYIKGTLGCDGEEVDCFMGSKADAEYVYIINQAKAPAFNEFDEQKVMLGFDSPEEAKRAYLDHYNDERFFMSMIELGINEFKIKLEERGEKIDHTAFSLPMDMSKSVITLRSLAELKKSGERPPGGGWQPIPGGTHGGFRKRKGSEWEYWYPGQLSHAVHETTHPPTVVNDPWSDHDPTKWFPTPGPNGPPVAWTRGGVDPHSKHPVKVGGVFSKLYVIEDPNPEGNFKGYAKLRDLKTDEIHYEPHNNVFKVDYDPERGKRPPPTAPGEGEAPWTPGGRPEGAPVAEKGAGERLKPFAETLADEKTQPGLFKLESGYFTWKEVSRIDVDDAGHKRIVKKRVPGVPQHVKMQLLQEFTPLMVNTAKQVQRSYNLKGQREITADGRARDVIREELTRSAQEGLLRAIDAYEGGMPFTPLAQLYVRDYARLHASREFLGGIQIPAKHARNLSRFIAARAQAAKALNVDEPSPAQVAPFFLLRKRDLYPELTGAVGQQPVPEGAWHPKAGEAKSEAPAPGKMEWTEMYHSFLTGQKTAVGSEFFEEETISTATGSGAGLDLEDRIAVRNAIGRALPQLKAFEVTTEGRKKITYRADVGEMIKMRLGIGEVEEASTRAIAKVVPIEVKRGGKWARLGERQANDLIDTFLEQGLMKLTDVVQGPRAKEIIAAGAERVLPPVKLPQGPTFSEMVAEKAKQVSPSRVAVYRSMETSRLQSLAKSIKARASTMKGPDAEVQRSLAAGAEEAAQRIIRMPESEIRKRIVMAESRTTEEMRRLATATVMLEGSSPGAEYGRAPMEVTDLGTGQKRIVNVRTIKELVGGDQLYKSARNDGNDLSPAMIREATTWPTLMSTLLGDGSLLGSAPTHSRFVAETMAGLL